jgi:hypothetical protein
MLRGPLTSQLLRKAKQPLRSGLQSPDYSRRLRARLYGPAPSDPALISRTNNRSMNLRSIDLKDREIMRMSNKLVVIGFQELLRQECRRWCRQVYVFAE